MIYPSVYNMTIEQRANFAREFHLSDHNRDPLDMTSYTLSAGLWTPSRKLLYAFTLAWVDQVLGQFTISLTPAQTSTLSGSAIWDLLVEDPDSNLDYWLRGQVRIEPGFTI